MEIKGIGGSIELSGEKIIIKRKGVGAFISHGLKGDKEIFIKQISSIQLKKVNFLTNGYIQFSFLGGKETKGGIMDAAKDENTVMFNKKQQKDFITLKENIEKSISTSNNQSFKANNNFSELDQLEKLASLKERGIISEEEFNIKKKQALGL